MVAVGDLVVFTARHRIGMHPGVNDLTCPLEASSGDGLAAFRLDGVLLVVAADDHETGSVDFCVLIRDAAGQVGVIHQTRVEAVSLADPMDVGWPN